MKQIFEQFLPVLQKCPLFEGIASGSITALLDCISARQRCIAKGAFVFMEDDELHAMGIILSGAIHIIRDDYWGNARIIARAGPGELFGEAFVCGGVQKMPVSALAVEPTEALFIGFNRVTTICSSACAFHTRLIKNMIANLARKNISLMEKIEHVTRHNTREKILSWLSHSAKEQGSNAVELPFNRQEMADYLAIERSALSAELCRMRDEGLITFHRNRFELL